MDPRDDTDGPEWVLWNFGHLVSMVFVLSATAQEVGWMWTGSPLEKSDREREESVVRMRDRVGNGEYEAFSRIISIGGVPEEDNRPAW